MYLSQYLEYYQYNRALDALKVDVAQAGERFGPVPGDTSDAVNSDLNQVRGHVMFTGNCSELWGFRGATEQVIKYNKSKLLLFIICFRWTPPQNELLALYDEGDCAEFYKVWRNNVPKESQLCDKECITMTFQLHLHFLVYPLRGKPHVRNLTTYMSAVFQSWPYFRLCAFIP